ncbi:MAG: hypothetical protein U5K76_13090 [Woeseiaceae bacterium]|nr:hypothetical protein [Woeseiaceae bacterium]
MARHDGGELTDTRWLAPEHALELAGREELALPPPTRRTLQALAAFGTVADTPRWAGEREAAGVAPDVARRTH